uniref:Uncharacterized protein n=1 Tax=Anopheles farauti TaxID=69004 RepID=A0A182Q2C1_9DIPT
MATNGTVLRFRALYAATVPWLVTLSILLQLAAPFVATPTKASKSGTDSKAANAAYRSYHFVLLVKSNGSNRTDHDSATSNVSEELVIMPTDADLLEQSDGGAIELKPQPLPSHITSAFVKQYHSNRASSRKRSQAAASSPTSVTKLVENARTDASLVEPSILLHKASREAAKKQRYPKKVSVETMDKTKRPTDKAIRQLDSTKLDASLRHLSLADIDLAPYELVATSKGLNGQPRTVRKTPAAGEVQQPRYEVIGTFRDAHVLSRARARRQSDKDQEDESSETMDR